MEKVKIAFLEVRLSILEEILSKNIPGFKKDYIESLELLKLKLEQSETPTSEVMETLVFEHLKQVDSELR